jgi:hypothetical protein
MGRSYRGTAVRTEYQLSMAPTEEGEDRRNVTVDMNINLMRQFNNFETGPVCGYPLFESHFSI